MSTVEKVEKNKVKLTINISAEEFEAALNEAFKKNAHKFSLPGFRKGKAPRKVIENNYGEGVFFEDAFNIAFPKAYEAAVVENGIDPVDQPDIDISDINKDNGVDFTATVTVKPEVTLGQYEGISISKVVYTVKDEELDAELNDAREKVARMVAIEDRPVQNGDHIMLDYSGSIDGVKFDGGTAQNQPLVIGSGSFIPGFEEQLIGLSLNEEKDISVSFPEEYQAPDLAGKAAVFAVKINQIQEKVLPALDDEFAKDVSEFETLQEYKDDLRNKMQEAADKRAEVETENTLIEKVVENAEVEVPDVMVETEVDYILRDMEMRLYYQGLRFEDYLRYTGATIEGLREQNKEAAAKRVKMRLVMEAIIKAENITADEESINKEIARMAEQAKKTEEDYKKTINEKQMEYLKEQVTLEKLVAFLKEKNKAD